MFYRDERLALFLDGWNLHSSAKGLGFEVDFRRLLEEFRRRGKLVRAGYYTALSEHEDTAGVRPLINWLSYNGYKAVTRTAVEVIDPSGRRRLRARIDIALTVDAMELGTKIDHAVLFSGDGTYRSLVVALQRKGVRVSVVSSVRSNPPMIADDLRRQADNYIDLEDLRELIERVRSGEDQAGASGDHGK